MAVLISMAKKQGGVKKDFESTLATLEPFLPA